MCLFRNRYLYVFGGTQLKSKSEIDELQAQANNSKAMANQKIDMIKEGSDSDKMSADKDEQEDEDALSAEAVSEDSFFDEEENEENYEIDFGEHYVTQIERLDLNVS